MHFTVTSNSLDDDLEQQIESFVSEHPDAGLIVIDTLQKIRRVINDNAYANDYRDLSILKAVADKLGIAILLIHHLRKQKDDDPLNMVSGTTGITGAVDSSFVLEKDKRSLDCAKLYCSGRDIEYRELGLRFDGESHIWTLLADSVENSEQLLDNTVSLVCSYLHEHICFKGRPSELAEAISKQTGTIIPPNVMSRRLNQHQDELQGCNINYRAFHSNGKRMVELHLHGAGGDGICGSQNIVTTDPTVPTAGAL